MLLNTILRHTHINIYREGVNNKPTKLVSTTNAPELSLTDTPRRGFVSYQTSHQYWHGSVPVIPTVIFVSPVLFQEAAAPQGSARRVRFIQFASVVYEQEPYMTPRDFLFSVMLENVDSKML